MTSFTKDQPFTAKCGDHTLLASVSPCSWMHAGYGLQLRVEIEGARGHVFLHDKARPFEGATLKHALDMLAAVRIIPCKTCGQPAFDPAAVKTNRDGQCEVCFMQALTADLEQDQAKEQKKIARLDAKRKAEGFTHRVDAWIHPARGGDDYQMSMWMKDPTTEAIQNELKKQRSVILTDYRTTPL